MTMRIVTPTGNRPNWAKVVNSNIASLANGILVDSDGDSIVGGVADRPGGFMVDAIVTEGIPRFYRLAVSGDVVFDTAFTSQTEGVIVYSDGDGTYSVTKPTSGATNTVSWMVGTILSSTAAGTYIHVEIHPLTDSVT